MELDAMKEVIKKREVKMIRAEYTDILGINRGKMIPAANIAEVVLEGLSFCSASLGMAFNNYNVPSAYFPKTYEDMRLVIDKDTFELLPNNTALLLGDLYYGGKPLAQSPRGFLRRMIDEYNKLGIVPFVASELEFSLYNKLADGKLDSYTKNPCMGYVSNARVDEKQFFYKLTETFSKIGFNVLYMNHEYGSNQFEYNWKHSKALRAADETALFKNLSKDIADENDMCVTFMAKPLNSSSANGCHFHISLNDENGENLGADGNLMSPLMENFIAGVLYHANGITAFLSPTINCYKRFRLDSLAPVSATWGYDNRTAYIRALNEHPQNTRAEVRAASAASNPYLALGAILAAGLDGIKNKMTPPAPAKDAYKESVCTFPRTLRDALDFLKKDEFIVSQAGRELVDIFCGLKNEEIKDFEDYVTDWEWDTYSYHL
ncbi:glutamate--ammonia ligase [Clostridia bacterium]|nr:glutamate--ammonia ligase [Clostridia bacterium]